MDKSFLIGEKLYDTGNSEVEILKIEDENKFFAKVIRKCKGTYNVGKITQEENLESYETFNISCIGCSLFYSKKDTNKGFSLLKDSKYKWNFDNIYNYYKNKKEEDLNKIKENAPTSIILTNELRKKIIQDYGDTQLQYKEEKMFFEKYSGKYFARADFDVDYYKKSDRELFEQHYYDKVYFGEKDVRDENGNLIIASWKCPIATIIYNDSILSFNPQVAGVYNYEYELLLKRKFDTKKNILKYTDVFIAENKTFDNMAIDSFLLDMLTRLKNNQKDDVARDIIKTIQKEQDKIIREDLGVNFYLQGCAGSGKTAVMMHRLSYLLYNNRKLDTNRIKIISPNQNMIEHLRELSTKLEISEIQQLTIEKYYLHIISKLSKEVFEYYSKMFQDIKTETSINSVFLDYIYSDEFLIFLKTELKLYLDELFFAIDKSLYFENYSLKEIQQNCQKVYEIYQKKGIDNENRQQQKAYRKILVREGNNKFKEEYKLSALKIIQDVSEIVLNKKYKEFGILVNKNDIYKFNIYIALCILRSLVDLNDVDFMLNIDEAQDISLCEYKLIKSFNQKAIYNLYGDTNQLINNRGIARWDQLEFFKLKKYILNDNYRNTEQITNFCNKELNFKIMRPIGVKGPDVEFIQLDDIKTIENGFAIIAKNPDLYNKYFYDKKKYSIIQHKSDIRDKSKINVYSVEMAKGMEFSKVIVIEKDMNKRERYIAYTRALQELKVIR